MTMMYLCQSSNELTGENSAIMIRALPRRSGWDDAWLPAFGVDARRRIGRLLGGAFREMEVSLAVSLLGDVVGGFHSWMKKAGNDEGDDEDTAQCTGNQCVVLYLSYIVYPMAIVVRRSAPHCHRCLAGDLILK